PPRSVTKSSSGEKPLIDNEVSPAADDSAAGRSRQALPTEKPAPPPALLDAPPSLLRPPESPSDSARLQPSRPSPGPKTVEAKNGEWALLGGKMRALGVSRFTIHAAPAGHVVFPCLIPLAGRQTVSQRFESSGDDIMQAARTALRRVILWRATQPSYDNPSAQVERSGP